MTWQQVLLSSIGAAATGASTSIAAQASGQPLQPGQAPNINWQWTGIVAGLFAFGQLAQALSQHPASQQAAAANPGPVPSTPANTASQ